LLNFHPACQNPTARWHYDSKCKDCAKIYQKHLRNIGYHRPSENKLSTILIESKRKNVVAKNHRHGAKLLDFTIKVNDVEELISAQTINNKLLCAATGIPLIIEKLNPLYPSIDRLNNLEGYTPGNIRIVAYMYNLARNNYNDNDFVQPQQYETYDAHTIATAIRKSPVARGKKVPKANELVSLIESQTINGKLICAATNEPFGPLQFSPFSPSLDRIDYNKGYDIDNIKIVTHAFNRGRNRFNFDTAAEIWKQLLTKLRERFSLGRLFDDEWLIRQQHQKNALLKYRPAQVEFKLINHKTASDFYIENHYIGKCISTYNIGGFINNRLISCLSLRRPSRQSSDDWEISRMARIDHIIIPGLWSYLWKNLDKIIKIKGKIVSYSDNRLHSGKVYEYMGFKHVSNIPSDYYWYKNGKRHHKSKMRKTEHEKTTGLTEHELRYAQGYCKIYDEGKKKWEYIKI